MRDRYHLALGFSRIAEALRTNFRRPGDAVEKLAEHKLLEHDRPQNTVLQLRYDEMSVAFVEVIDLMWRNQNPLAMLVAFEKAVLCQEDYYQSHTSAFGRALHKIKSGKA